MKLKAVFFWEGSPLSFFFFNCNFYTQTLGERGQDIVLFCLSAAVFYHTAGNGLLKIHSRYWKGVEAEGIFRRPCIQYL